MADLEDESGLTERMNGEATIAVGYLDDMRITARDVAKHLERAGVPQELHWEAIQIMERLESLESRVGEYVSNIENESGGNHE